MQSRAAPQRVKIGIWVDTPQAPRPAALFSEEER
jgi:hypothetical protein